MERILKFKHWQLFLLIFICGSWVSPSPLQEIINSIALITFFIWAYSIGIFGQKRINKQGFKKGNVNFFKINLLVVLVYFILSFFVIKEEVQNNYNTDFTIIDLVLMLFSFYAFFAFIYISVFISKTITTLDLKKEVAFSEYLTSLLFIVFFPIGIWFIQPKVTKLIAK